MKNKLFTKLRLFKVGKKLIGFGSILILLAGVFCGSVSAQSSGEYETLIDGITSWKMAQTNTGSVQALVDSGLSLQAGTGAPEWTVIALRQYKNSYAYSAYTAALNQYVSTMKSKSATDLQRIALAYSAAGGNAGFVQNTINGTIGKLGITSYVYGLILLDSGAYTNTPVSRDEIIAKILSLELSDGGWALKGNASDVDITAMTLQALAPYYRYADVKPAVDKALALLSGRQLENGDYASWGTRNAESTAQVIAALAALNLSGETDSRFVKNGHTLLDGLLCYRLPDGSFSHTIGGASDNTASVQALYSLVATWRQAKGLGPLFRFTSKVISRDTSTSTVSPNRSEPVPNVTASSGPEQSDGIESPGGTLASSDAQNGSSDVSDDSSELTDDTDFAGLNEITNTTQPAPNQNAQVKSSTGYKSWACLGVGILALLAVGILFLTKKNHKKNIFLVLGLTAAALLAVLLTNIQTVGQYYAAHPEEIQPGSKTVTVSVRCDTVADKQNADIPSDGCILDKTQMVLQDGDTVFDVLVRAAKQNKLQLDYEGGTGSAYVKGIQYLYEKEFGDTSGWMYQVNGQFESVGCSDYKLSDGDVVEWVYTCDLGKDVGNE